MTFKEIWDKRPWIRCPDYGKPEDQSGLFAAEYIYGEMSNKINSLQKQLDIAMEAIDFYGDNNTSWESEVLPNWSGRIAKIVNQDVEVIGNFRYGGKRARGALRKIEAIKEGK